MVYTVQKGKKAARPRIFRFGFGRNTWAVWRIELLEGWEYVLPTNQTQWVKLCGKAFGFSSNQNTILLGARHIPGTGVQITPYYNVRGKQWYPESHETPKSLKKNWPIINTNREYSITFGITAEDRKVTTTMINDGMREVHSVYHSGIHWFHREVNFYFGGSVPASNLISIEKKRLLRISISPEDGGIILT